MQPENAIEVRDLTKKFKVFYDKGNQLKEKILFHNRNRYENRWVLNGISFNVRRGEAIGLIGHNGCGKSTTLKLLTKIIYPDSGTIEMRGRVSSLIELGAGFHPDMSGRENIYTNASIFGLSKKEIDARVAQIIEFSELEEFIDNPVRTYSSGMYMRLAFSVAINVDADILLIDEILGVGDAHFQEKCFDKLQSIKRNGTTIVIVSHSMGQIEEICDRCIWIDQGKIRMEGETAKVDEAYLEYMGVKKRESNKQKLKEENEEKKRQETAFLNKVKNSHYKLQSVQYVAENGATQTLYDAENNGTLKMIYSVEGICEDANISFRMKKDKWLQCWGTNLKTKPVSVFNTEVKETEFLSSLVAMGTKSENLIPRMNWNDKVEKIDSAVIIHPDGVIYGPYLNVPAMLYKIRAEIECEEDMSPMLVVTKEAGKVRLSELQLKNGYNEGRLTLEEDAAALEFVISNQTEKDIIVKSIELI